MQAASLDEDDGTLAGRIARTLADRIVAGTIAPGTRLRQDHVAAEFRASHVPVREAFRRLEAQGLVDNEPRRGARVPPLGAGSAAQGSLRKHADLCGSRQGSGETLRGPRDWKCLRAQPPARDRPMPSRRSQRRQHRPVSGRPRDQARSARHGVRDPSARLGLNRGSPRRDGYVCEQSATPP